MRIHIRVLMIALLTLGWSGVALSEDSVKTPFNSASAANMDGLSLDIAFEEATSPQHHGKLKNLGGPTSMECQHPATKSDLETCVVTADGMLVSLPAALAQH